MEEKPYRPLVPPSSRRAAPGGGRKRWRAGGAAGAGRKEGGPLLSPLPHLPHGNRPPERQKTAQAEPHNPLQVGSPASPLDLGTPALWRQLPLSLRLARPFG